MTVIDQLDKDLNLIIEGESAKKSKALHLDELLEKQEFEIVEPNEPIDSNGNLY